MLKDGKMINVTGRNLRELYLRQNAIQDIEEVNYLQSLPNLQVLWLSENPCTDFDGYREFILRRLPNLVKLDDREVSDEERMRALHASHVPTPLSPQMSPHKNDFGRADPRASNAAQAIKYQRRRSSSSSCNRDAHRPAVNSEQPRGLPRNRRSAWGNEDSEQRPARKTQPHQLAPARRVSGTLSSQRNVAQAIVSLLKELDADHLQWVRQHIDAELMSN